MKQNECHDVCVIFGCVYKVVVPKAAALAIVQDAQGSMPQSVQAVNVRATDCTSKSLNYALRRRSHLLMQATGS